MIKRHRSRFWIILFSVYCFLLSLNVFHTVMIQNRMTTDDCLWTYIYDTASKRYTFLISDIIPGGVADSAGIKDGDVLLEIEGLSFMNMEDAMRILQPYQNEFVRYTILREGEIIYKDIWVYKHLNILFLIFWLMGTGFLIVGFIVGFSKPSELSSKIFFFLGCCASLGFVMYGNANLYVYDFDKIFENLGDFAKFFLFINHLAAMLAFQAILFHFFATYPKKFDFKGKRKFVIISVYVIAFLPSLFTMFFNLLSDNTIFRLGYFIIYVLPAVIISVSLIMFMKSYRQIEDQQNKKSIRIIRNGFIIAAFGAVYFIIYQIFFSKPIFLVNNLLLLPIITVLAIPLSFGYSIIKYRILDTEYLIKRGIVFGIVSFIIIVVYLSLVYLIDSYIGRNMEFNRQYLIVAFIIFVTFTFDFVNNKAKDFVDKIFYKERYNFRKSLLEFSHQLSYIKNIDEILIRIREEVNKSLGINILKIWITDDKYLKMIDKTSIPENFLTNYEEVKVITNKLFHKSAEPAMLSYAFYRDYNLNEKEIEIIKYCGINLAVPLFIHNNLIGSLNFGPKISGKAFSDEDLDLLRTISVQTAISIENYRLEKEELSKKKIEEELLIARRIQTGLLPESNFNSDKINISGISVPARIIGGDFFDVIKSDDNKIYSLVADVSGKGIPAAIYMSKVQSVIQFATTVIENPKDILIEINKQIFEQIERKYFITIIFLMFDFNNNLMKVCRAGHLPMILFRNGKTEKINPRGIGLGLEKGKIFEKELEEFIIPIKKNDVYFIYSDGLTESFNEQNEEFGLERCIRIIEENINGEPEHVKRLIISDVHGFMGSAEQHDDITFEIIKIK
ncbi:MAG: SpoIIE family protein phosphatase [Ignavibacteria bacterium]|nr:SpoIIE family protein phosphatase [Ignavibacteria bacterium]